MDVPEAIPSQASQVVESLALSSRQAALLGMLEKRAPEMARMYSGAVRALADEGNGDRFAQTAHSLRELMEKLPEHLDVPATPPYEALKPRVLRLKGSFEKLQRQSACFKDGRWLGEIDPQLDSMLSELGDFFRELEEMNPTRKDSARSLVTRLDVSERSLPPALIEQHASNWEITRDLLTSIAHHRKELSPEAFSLLVEGLENFLLDRMQPATFEHMSEIDKIVRAVK